MNPQKEVCPIDSEVSSNSPGLSTLLHTKLWSCKAKPTG